MCYHQTHFNLPISVQLEQWPEFYSTAFDVLDSQNNVDAMEGFVDAILKISEEAPLAFENILDAATNKVVKNQNGLLSFERKRENMYKNIYMMRYL